MIPQVSRMGSCLLLHQRHRHFKTRTSLEESQQLTSRARWWCKISSRIWIWITTTQARAWATSTRAMQTFITTAVLTCIKLMASIIRAARNYTLTLLTLSLVWRPWLRSDPLNRTREEVRLKTSLQRSWWWASQKLTMNLCSRNSKKGWLRSRKYFISSRYNSRYSKARTCNEIHLSFNSMTWALSPKRSSREQDQSTY